ncbi:MAG: Lrp/AsnC family transcriptional regulator [Promethearchaeota archaeon]
MTLTAIILIDVDPPLTDAVYNQLKGHPDVKEVSSVYGIHDIFLLITVPDEESLNEFVFSVLRPTEGIKETLTLMVTRTLRKN